MKQIFFSLLKVRVSVGILPFQIHTLTLQVAQPDSSSPAASPTLGHVPRGGPFRSAEVRVNLPANNQAGARDWLCYRAQRAYYPLRNGGQQSQQESQLCLHLLG